MARWGYLPKPSGDARADAVRELRWAMAGDGLTLEKLPVMTAVMELPVVARAVATVGPGHAEKVAYDAITAASRALGNTPQSRLLRCVLAIDYDGGATDLTGRRTEFVRRHNAGVRAAGRRDYLPESSRGLYNVEQSKLEELVTALGAGVVRRSADQSAPATRRPYTCMEYDVTYRLSGRTGQEAEFVYVIRADADGLDRFTSAYYTVGDDGELADLVVHEGGYVVAKELRGEPGSQIDTIALPRALAAGECQRVRLDVRYPPGRVLDSYFVLSILRPTKSLVVRTSFRGEVPGLVWRVDRVYPNVGFDADRSSVLVPDTLSCVETRFDDLHTGFTYGIAWQW